MITENLSTLKIHKLTQEQYEREVAAGRIDENAIYLTPDEVGAVHADTLGGESADFYASKEYVDTNINSKMEQAVGVAIDNVDCIYCKDVGTSASVNKINADTLQNKSASDFAPSGYGLGGYAAINNTNTKNSGFYHYGASSYNAPFSDSGDMIVANNLQISMSNNIDNTVAFKNYIASDSTWEYLNPPMETDVWYPTVERLNNKQLTKKLNSNGIIEISTTNGTTSNTLGSLCGSGLGVIESPQTNDCNSIENMKNGWYSVSAQSANMPTSADGLLFNHCYNANNVKQVYTSLEGSYNCQRMMINGQWQPWEWINPPMLPNTPYRTTERWNGKAVYKRLIHIGALGSGTSAPAMIQIPETNISPLGFTGYVSGENIGSLLTVPYKNANGSREIWGYITQGSTGPYYLVIYTNYDASHLYGYFEIKYIFNN